MKKIEKHVKFELPHHTIINNDNSSEIYQSKTAKRDLSLLSDARIFPSIVNAKLRQISTPSTIPLLQRKIRNDTRLITYGNSKSTVCTAKFPSSIINTQSKRTVISTTDKISSYLSKSKIFSTTSSLTEIKKPSVNYSRISYVDATSISRSTRMNFQLANYQPTTYLHAKIPPIDKTRKFCTTNPERCRNFITDNGSVHRSMINTNINQFDRHLNTKMEMLQSNIPWSKILPATRPNSAFSDNTIISYGNQLLWVSLKF